MSRLELEEFSDLRIWGYSIKELRSMRDFAIAHGWDWKSKEDNASRTGQIQDNSF